LTEEKIYSVGGCGIFVIAVGIIFHIQQCRFVVVVFQFAVPIAGSAHKIPSPSFLKRSLNSSVYFVHFSLISAKIFVRKCNV
jgi:hypothetical protein